MSSVLILEPDPSLRSLLREIFTDRGASVKEASTAEEALQQLEGVGLVVLDFDVALRNGRKFLLSVQGAGIDLPVILLTSGGPHVEEEGFHISYRLQKPLQQEALLGIVDRALETARSIATIHSSDARLTRALLRLRQLYHGI